MHILCTSLLCCCVVLLCLITQVGKQGIVLVIKPSHSLFRPRKCWYSFSNYLLILGKVNKQVSFAAACFQIRQTNYVYRSLLILICEIIFSPPFHASDSEYFSKIRCDLKFVFCFIYFIYFRPFSKQFILVLTVPELGDWPQHCIGTK